MKTHILLVTSMLLVAVTLGNAQTAYRERPSNRWHKRERIEHGRHTGQLSPRECRKLRGAGHKIHQTKRCMLQDGRLGRHERQKLDRMHRHHSRMIWREKHDGNRW